MPILIHRGFGSVLRSIRQESEGAAGTRETRVAIAASKKPAVFLRADGAGSIQVVGQVDAGVYRQYRHCAVTLFSGQKETGIAVGFAKGLLPARFAQHALNN